MILPGGRARKVTYQDRGPWKKIPDVVFADASRDPPGPNYDVLDHPQQGARQGTGQGVYGGNREITGMLDMPAGRLRLSVALLWCLLHHRQSLCQDFSAGWMDEKLLEVALRDTALAGGARFVR